MGLTINFYQFSIFDIYTAIKRAPFKCLFYHVLYSPLFYANENNVLTRMVNKNNKS